MDIYLSVYIFDSSVYADHEAFYSMCKTPSVNWRVTVTVNKRVHVFLFFLPFVLHRYNTARTI